MSVRIATVIGATGLIGNELLKLLQQDDHFSTVRVLVRRPFSKTNFKTEVKLIDFSDPESFKLAIDGSHTVFCAIGTTQKKVAGNKEAYRKVDHDIAVNAARYCKATGGSQFLLVSSVGAKASSRNFYLKLKGEIEDKIRERRLPSVAVFRPSFLLGERDEKRNGEKVVQGLMQGLSFLLPSKYKPISAEAVASAMMEAAKREQPGFHIYEFNEMQPKSRV
jgi:uncharacterized protein YbjT (DUF2867 family)